MIKDRQIKFHRLSKVGTLNLNRNLFAGMQTPSVDLSQRRLSDRLDSNFEESVLQRHPEIAFDPGVSLRCGERRHLVLEQHELLYVGKRKEIGARTQALANFYKGGPQLDQISV